MPLALTSSGFCNDRANLMGFKREEMIDYENLTHGSVAGFLEEAANSKIQLFIQGQNSCNYNQCEENEIMSAELDAVKVSDLKGLSCPMHVVKVSKGIKEVEVGEVIQAITH